MLHGLPVLEQEVRFTCVSGSSKAGDGRGAEAVAGGGGGMGGGATAAPPPGFETGIGWGLGGAGPVLKTQTIVSLNAYGRLNVRTPPHPF